MKQWVKKWTLAVGFLAVMICLSSCAKNNTGSATNDAGATNETSTTDNNEVTTIKIGYLPITHAAPLYLEDDNIKEGKTTPSKFKLELVKFGSWPDLIDALNAGKIDGASVLVELAMKAKEQGIPLKAVALGHKEGNVIVVSKDINSAADLKGKTFAIPHKFSSHNILFYEMLKQANVPLKDVNVVELAPDEMPAALSEGRISGYCVAEPFGAISVVADKGKVLFQSGKIWDGSICCILVLRDELISKNPEAVQEFVNDYAIGGKEAETKDAHVREILRKYMKIDDKTLDLSLKWISYKNLDLTKDDYTKLVNFLTEMKLAKQLPTYDEFVDPSFLKKAEQTQ